jgi:hypothetical protein
MSGVFEIKIKFTLLGNRGREDPWVQILKMN